MSFKNFARITGASVMAAFALTLSAVSANAQADTPTCSAPSLENNNSVFKIMCISGPGKGYKVNAQVCSASTCRMVGSKTVSYGQELEMRTGPTSYFSGGYTAEGVS